MPFNHSYTHFIDAESNRPEGDAGKYRGLSITIPTTQPTPTPQQEQVIKYRGVVTQLYLA